MLLYWRTAVHSPEVQPFTSIPFNFETFRKLRLIGAVVEVPGRRLTFYVEYADFVRQLCSCGLIGRENPYLSAAGNQ
jgi:hypothetical protein